MILYTIINFGAFNKCQALIKVDGIHILCLTLKVIVKALYYKECKSLKTCSLIYIPQEQVISPMKHTKV